MKQFELVVDQRVLGRLLFAQGPFLLEFRAPERFDAVHAGPELLIGQLQFLLEVGQFAVQVSVLMLELAQEVAGVAGVGHEVATAASDTAARRLSGPGRYGSVRVIVQAGEPAAVAAVPVEPVVAVVAVLSAGVGQYAATAGAAGVPIERLVPRGRHDAHPVRGTAGTPGPVRRASGRAHGSSPFVQQHGAVEVIVPVVRRRHAAAADAQAATADARLVGTSAVVVGRPGSRPDRPPAYRAVALAAASASATRPRRIRPGRRPVDRRQFRGYAPGAAGRARARGSQRRSRAVGFPGRHRVWRDE